MSLKGSIRVTGMAQMRLELRQTADRVPEASRKTMHRSAEIIVREARLNTPRDIGNLENAIQILRDYQGLRGRLQIDIGIVPTGDETNRDGKDIEVMDYAALIHENYESMNPGKRTLAKMQANPGRVIGSGFLRRAADDEAPKLIKKTISVIDKTIQEIQG